MVMTIVLIIVVLVVSLQHNNTNTVSRSGCGPYRNDKTVTIGVTKLAAEVVKTPTEFAKGLGGRPCIEYNQAMLFIFGKPSHYGFWMKDMRFPIDIVWIASDHKVVGLQDNIQPSSYPARFSNKDKLAQFVIEIQANRSKSLHIVPGTSVDF